MTGAPAVFTIPAGVCFVDALALGMLEKAGGDPLALTRMTVLLPTRRAARSLREAFLRLADGRPLLLPQMMPLGDLDDEELDLATEAGPGEGGLELAPAIPTLRRQILLAMLIVRQRPIPPEQAAALARELARLLDQVQTERLSLADIARLVPDDYADHWQLTLAFLEVLSIHWPDILAAEGALDPAERRNSVLEAQAALWRSHPAGDPVIAAGSTGSIPATADLLATIAGLPHGMVVLPGLDRSMPAEDWALLEPGHPQFGLKLLLDKLAIAPEAVADWPTAHLPAGALPATDPRRAALLGLVMAPAESAERWGAVRAQDLAGLDGVARIDCIGPQEEAGAISLLMRAVLERPAATAALVTPDRDLARRVAAELRRFGIEVDDSAGTPLVRTAPGAFLQLVAELGDAPPLPLLALLKHPLSAGGRDPAGFRAEVRRLERLALRGPRPALGLAALADHVERDETAGRPAERVRLAGFCRSLAALVAPLQEALRQPAAALPDLVRVHVRVAEALAATDQETGAERLWRSEAGEAAARFVADLIGAGAGVPAVPGDSYPGLYRGLSAGLAVRPRYGLHPRLAILGPLEARLLHADRMILGGLNEGTWPADPPVDAWLSRPMRKAFGLPSLERRIGLAAHDFAQAFAAPEVFLTRAERVDGVPTVPSRWLRRLDAVLQAAGEPHRLATGLPVAAWWRALDTPTVVQPCAPPAPRPPLAARPRRLSVTAIERWMRDPYEIYAARVLRLQPLEPLDADPGAAERGQFIHAALDAFVRDCPGELPPDALERLLAHGRAAFGAALDRPGIWAFWWPRFERVARWFVELEAGRRPALTQLAAEVAGEWVIAAGGGAFTLTAIADRIERRRDGGLAILDYKTGAPPRTEQVVAGLSPQLSLEAAMALAGAFPGIAPAAVTELAYVRLSGGEPAGEVRPIEIADLPGLIAAAEAGLRALIDLFDRPETPYLATPRPDRASAYPVYSHLARTREWSTAGSDEE